MAAGGAENEPYPILGKILVRFGDKIAAADTLDEALEQVFGGSSAPASPPESEPEGGDDDQASAGGGGQQLSEDARKAIADLQKAVSDYEAAQKNGDYPGMGDAWKRIKDAQAALAAAQSRPADSPGPAASPSPTGSPPEN